MFWRRKEFHSEASVLWSPAGPADGYAMSAVTVLLRRRKLTVSTLLLSIVTVILLYTIPNLSSNKETLQNHQVSNSMI